MQRGAGGSHTRGVLVPALRATAGRRRAHAGGEAPSLAVQMGARVSRDSLFYSIVSGVIFPLGFANALVLTNFLSTRQYGQLSVVFTVSGLVTVILNLVYLRGTERLVWGSSDEGLDVDVAELVESHLRPRALGTGVVMSVLLGVFIALAVVPVATPLSSFLLHTSHLRGAIIWGGISAGLGAVYRLTWNIVRWERRKAPYGIVYAIRPALAILIAWPLVANGAGVTGAVAATALATFASCAFGLTIARKSYSVVLNRQDAIEIVKSSGPMAALMVAIYALHNGDVVLLSRFASQSQVGIYRLAGNLTSVVSYVVSAFLMAWAPLEHSSLFEAAYEHYGKARMRGEFVIYFMAFSCAVTLLMSALATPLVGLFSPRYFGAQAFVAITSAAWVAYGLFIVTGRSSEFPRRYLWYAIASTASVVALVVTSILLGPSLGGYGVATGDVVGGLTGVAIIAVVAVRGGNLPAVSLLRFIKLLVITGGCYVLGDQVAAAIGGAWDVVLKVASVALYPLLLVGSGVIPTRHLKAVSTIVRRSVRARTRPEMLIERISELPSTERRVLLAIARDGESVSRVRATTGVPERTVGLRLVAALRRIADAGQPGDHDHAVADYLLTPRSVTMREGIARELWEVGIPAVELHQIETAFDALRNAPAKAWAASALQGGRELPPAPWRVSEREHELLEQVVRYRRPRHEVAADLDIRVRELDRQLIGVLRRLTNGGGPQAYDSLIAAFMFDHPPTVPARQLWAAGVDPLALHELELAVEEIRALKRGDWGEATARQPAEKRPKELLPGPSVASVEPALIASAALLPPAGS